MLCGRIVKANKVSVVTLRTRLNSDKTSTAVEKHDGSFLRIGGFLEHLVEGQEYSSDTGVVTTVPKCR